MAVEAVPQTIQQLLCRHVGIDAAMYLRESGIVALVSLLQQGSKACWYAESARLEVLAEELVDLYLLEKEATEELAKAESKQQKMQETLQLLTELLARVPKAEQAEPWTNYDEWQLAAGMPKKLIINQRHRNLGRTRLDKAGLPEPEAEVPSDAAEPQEAAVTRPKKLQPHTVGQAVLMRLKAAQPSAKECQKVAAKVAHWASRLAVIHRQQQEIKDDMLQTWRTAFADLSAQQQLQDATAQLEAAKSELFKVSVLAETKVGLAKDRQEQLQERLSAAEAQVAAAEAQQHRQQQQQARREQQMQQMLQRLAAAEAEAAGYKQQLSSQQQEMQQLRQIKHQQEPLHPVQVTLKLQSDAAQLQHMAAQLAAAQAASAVVQLAAAQAASAVVQQQQQQLSKPHAAAHSAAADAAVSAASLSLALVVPAGMSREEQQQQEEQPATPVFEQQTVELEFSSNRPHMRRSSWGDSDSSSLLPSRHSSRHSSRRSSFDADTMAAVQQAVGQAATQLQQQAASLAASSAQVFSSLIGSEAAADGAHKQQLGGQLSRSNSSSSSHQTSAGAAADQSSSRTMQHIACSTYGGSSGGSSSSGSNRAAAYDTANRATLPAPKHSTAGGHSSSSSSSSSMQQSQSAVRLTAPPAAASSDDSVGFVPEFAAQLGRSASAWLGAQAVPHCQWLPAAGYHQR